MKLLGNMECPLSLLMTLTVVLSMLLSVQAYRHEVTFYDSFEDDADYHVYKSHVPDSKYWSSKAKRMCAHGLWMFYILVDYQALGTWLHSAGDEVVCKNVTFPFASFRYLGSNDTEVSTATFFNGFDSTGVQTVVTRLARGDMTARSYAITGTSSWTIYEGLDFDGQHKCITPTEPSLLVRGDRPSGWSNIGSVARGCEGHHGGANHFRA